MAVFCWFVFGILLVSHSVQSRAATAQHFSLSWSNLQLPQNIVAPLTPYSYSKCLSNPSSKYCIRDSSMFSTVLLLLVSALCSSISGRAVDQIHQIPLVHASADDYPGDVPGGIPGSSIVTLCEESQDTDILSIYRLVNMPQVPHLYVLLTINILLELCVWLKGLGMM